MPAFLALPDVQVVAVCDVNTASYGYRDKEQFLGRKPGQDKVNAYLRRRRKVPGNTKAATPTPTSARSSIARTSTPWRSSCPTTGTRS